MDVKCEHVMLGSIINERRGEETKECARSSSDAATKSHAAHAHTTVVLMTAL